MEKQSNLGMAKILLGGKQFSLLQKLCIALWKKHYSLFSLNVVPSGRKRAWSPFHLTIGTCTKEHIVWKLALFQLLWEETGVQEIVGLNRSSRPKIKGRETACLDLK